jgi:hypothetical protein
MRSFQVIFISINILLSCHSPDNKGVKKDTSDILRLEMKLSAFGVESDEVPNIDAYIDFKKDSSHCNKSYYNPKYADTVYCLTKPEIQHLLNLLEGVDLRTLKRQYTDSSSDLPTSTTIIYLATDTIAVVDYGLIGDRPLPDLYKIVYKK